MIGTASKYLYNTFVAPPPFSLVLVLKGLIESESHVSTCLEG